MIASDESLSRHDLAAMRLTRKVFTVPAATSLFRRVVISRLKGDQDALEHIAASEHLAGYVHELVWQELDIDTQTVQGENLVSDWNETITRVKDASSSKDLFWFPRMMYRDDREKPDTLSGSWFIEILSKFPKLTAFVSCPMPQKRTFTYEGYELQANLYQTRVFNNTQTGNTGFYSYSESSQRFISPHLS